MKRDLAWMILALLMLAFMGVTFALALRADLRSQRCNMAERRGGQTRQEAQQSLRQEHRAVRAGR